MKDPPQSSGRQARALVVLAALASLAAEAKQLGDASRLLDEASAVLENCSDPGYVGSLHAELAGSLVLPSVDESVVADLIEPLTPRGVTVLRLLTSNLTLAEIGREMHVPVNQHGQDPYQVVLPQAEHEVATERRSRGPRDRHHLTTPYRRHSTCCLPTDRVVIAAEARLLRSREHREAVNPLVIATIADRLGQIAVQE